MRLFFPILLLFFAAICASCGRRDFLSEDFGLSPADLENPRVVANGLAVVADCRMADFEKIRAKLEPHGFSDWKVFHGILGAGGTELIGYVKRPLYYSMKSGNRAEKPAAVAVYDPEKSLVYFTVAEDFGG